MRRDAPSWPPSSRRATDFAGRGWRSTLRFQHDPSADPKLDRRLAAIDHARGIIADLAPRRSLAAELIAERHAEAGSDATVASIEAPSGLDDPRSVLDAFAVWRSFRTNLALT
jgi:hypothetical protein